MGSIAALKLRKVVENVEAVIAIEFLAAAQGIDFLAPLKPGKGTIVAHRFVRQRIPTLDKDRQLSRDIESMIELMREDEFLSEVEEALG